MNINPLLMGEGLGNYLAFLKKGWEVEWSLPGDNAGDGELFYEQFVF